ncbi:putative N-ethylammeline chlorohydrolase [Oceanicola granulosus HTCC2516]|uniref:Putative N-ethylammeline chlorohydrolase n=1 Tax=Oceanicola granulosus (strain ATCC BAA-861 / DSM 15982 / KCTC 12143 / HTCC2516) TaxID=314256 RepID=Q2CJ94_OCEGH|nr:amidohydrolase [Oceanicola granulosus]EAR52706.1 putative N-ethylammeline chlorohydrolase [Oceanicola granulosus HTCC2516]
MRVDTLIRGGVVLTMDGDFTRHDAGYVAVTGGRISHVGADADAAGLSAERVIDAEGGIILPGFVNTHCHAAMTLFRGLADDVDLDGFLRTVWRAEAEHIGPASVELGAELAIAEMALSGVTHFLDMYWYPEATIAAAQRVGMGLTSGPPMLNVEGVDGMGWAERMAYTEGFLERYSGVDGVQPMLLPHGCYTLDADKLAEIANLARAAGCGVHIHAAEAAWEMQLVRDAYGTTPVRALERAGLLEQPLLLAHAVHLDGEEIALLADAGAGVAHCPLSNAKLASGMAPIGEMRASGVTLSLGTDGPASGNDLDMFATMRLAALVHNLRSGTSDTLPARDLVAMATSGGAMALGLGARTGSLEVGKQADITVVATDAPHNVPSYCPYSTLVFSAGRSEVRHVLARGRALVADGRPTTPTEPVKAEVRRLAADIANRRD